MKRKTESRASSKRKPRCREAQKPCGNVSPKFINQKSWHGFGTKILEKITNKKILSTSLGRSTKSESKRATANLHKKKPNKIKENKKEAGQSKTQTIKGADSFAEVQI